MGHERRVLQKTAACQLPLCPVSDRDRAAVQHVAKGNSGLMRRNNRKLLDHLVGAGKQLGRHVDAECLCRP
jgi:hypothetical protein